MTAHLLGLITGRDGQVGEQAVVRFEAEHIDGITTLLEETCIVVSDQLDCVVEESLRVKRIRVEVQRQNGLHENTIEPESVLFYEYYLEDANEDLRLALIVDEGAISLVVCVHHVFKPVLHHCLGHPVLA